MSTKQICTICKTPHYLYPKREHFDPQLIAFEEAMERIIQQRIKDGWDNPHNSPDPTPIDTPKTQRMPGF